ncbi:MAG: transcription antitermination factor NusB [Chloroflexi bacterium]|nr:transcription antitermination factor NusB [Chloroflexota bacterium]
MPLPQPDLGDLEPGDEVSVEEVPHQWTTHDNSLARQLALQAMYEIDSTGHPTGDVIDHLISAYDSPLPADVVRLMRVLVTGVFKHRVRIDAAIQPFAPEFPVKHLAVVDRNILRLAIFEFVIAQLVPMGVAIDEAVSLAKAFGSDSSPRFVNGVLGNLMEDSALVARMRAEIDPASSVIDGA